MICSWKKTLPTRFVFFLLSVIQNLIFFFLTSWIELIKKTMFLTFRISVWQIDGVFFSLPGGCSNSQTQVSKRWMLHKPIFLVKQFSCLVSSSVSFVNALYLSSACCKWSLARWSEGRLDRVSACQHPSLNQLHSSQTSLPVILSGKSQT